MSKFKNIRLALTGPLSGLSQTIVYPNSDYEPDPNETYLKVHLLMNRPTPVTLGAGGYNEHTGYLQIDIMVPRDSTDGPSLDLADSIEQIYQSYARGSRIVQGDIKVRVTSVELTPLSYEGTHTRSSVLVYFEANIKAL